MSPVLKEILKQTYTANDLHRRLRLWQECLESILYEEPQQMRVLSDEKRQLRAIQEIVPEDEQSFYRELPAELWSNFTPATLAGKMKAIIEESNALPVMTLYVPVAFTEKQIAPLSEWARREVNSALLFEILVDPKVVGGCAFVYKDTHFDWSLRKYLRAKRGMVNTLLNSYAE